MSHRRRVVNRRPACRLFATRTLIMCHMGCEQPLGRTARLRRWLAGRAAVCNPPPVSNSRRAILNEQKSSRNRAISLAIYEKRGTNRKNFTERAPARPPQRQNKEGRGGARPSRESHGLSSGAGQSTCGKTGQTSFATTHAVGPFDVWFWFDRISPLLWPLLLSV